MHDIGRALGSPTGAGRLLEMSNRAATFGGMAMARAWRRLWRWWTDARIDRLSDHLLRDIGFVPGPPDQTSRNAKAARWGQFGW